MYWSDNLGLGVTPKLELAAGVQRSSPYGGPARRQRHTRLERPCGQRRGRRRSSSLFYFIDQRLKNDFSSGGGSFYNGAGYPGTESDLAATKKIAWRPAITAGRHGSTQPGRKGTDRSPPTKPCPCEPLGDGLSSLCVSPASHYRD